MQRPARRISVALACLFCLGYLLGCPLYPPSWHAVSYDPNGATGGTAPTDFNRYPAGFAVTVAENTGSLTRTGYSFAGWNTEPDGSRTSLGAGDTFTMGDSDLTLYAYWSLIPPAYHVIYSLNGGSGATPSDSTDHQPGDKASVLDDGGFSRDGFTFVSWNTKNDGTGDAYDPGDLLTIGAADVRLYAVWLQNPPYHVTYNRNGSWDQPPVDPNEYQQGDAVTVLYNLSLHRIGYAFGGWNTRADGSGDGYGGGDTFTMGTADVTLYAVWVAGLRVSYHGNGHEDGTVPTDPYGYLEGDTVRAASEPIDLTRTGYNFASWNTMADGSGVNHAPGSDFTMPGSDVDLWALWIPDSLTIDRYQNSVIITGFTTASGHLEIPMGVTAINSSVFSGCTGLTGITLPATLDFIGDAAFLGCTSLESIVIPAGVTNIREFTFSGCSSLAGVTIPDSVSTLGWSVFRECSNLVSVTLSPLLTEIPFNTFNACSSLASITIPSAVRSIGGRAFEACDELLNVIVEAYDPPMLDNPGSVFNPFPLGRLIHVPAGRAAAYKADAGWSIYAPFITDE